VFVVIGFALGEGGFEVLQFDPQSGFVEAVAVTALVVILFRDGLEVEFEMLQRAWRPPLRKLVVGMPVTAAIVALAAKALTDLSWTEAFLLGALLSPTDPVLSNAVVTTAGVPEYFRERKSKYPTNARRSSDNRQGRWHRAALSAKSKASQFLREILIPVRSSFMRTCSGIRLNDE